MRPEYDHGNAEAWLRYARSDFEVARFPAVPGILLETLCFHAQQTAEKSLKAVLIARGIDFPRTHSLRRLLDLLPAEIAIPATIQAVARLTDYAVLSRYPGDLEPVEAQEYRETIRLAEAVLAWAENMIRDRIGVAPETPLEQQAAQPCERAEEEKP